MTVRPNPMKKPMKEGRLVISLSVNRWRNIDIAEIAKYTGFDWLFVDLEHSSITEENASQIALTALAAGISANARVSAGQFAQASRLLDAGFQGITFAHVDSPQEARLAAEATKYAPTGKRGIFAPQAQTEFVSRVDPKTLAEINEQTLTFVMIESAEGVANIDAIASVPGVDGVQMGANDLTNDLGIPGDLGHPKLVEAFDKIAAATRKHGKSLGLGGIYDPTLLKQFLARGVNFMHGGQEMGLMIDGAKRRLAMIRDAAPAHS